MALRGMLIAAASCCSLRVFGECMLRLFGITLPALRIAGGVLLLLISIDMVFARHSGGTGTTPEEENEAQTRADISVFPLATPLIAGPGAISAVILLTTGTGGFTLEWLVVVVALLGDPAAVLPRPCCVADPDPAPARSDRPRRGVARRRRAARRALDAVPARRHQGAAGWSAPSPDKTKAAACATALQSLRERRNLLLLGRSRRAAARQSGCRQHFRLFLLGLLGFLVLLQLDPWPCCSSSRCRRQRPANHRDEAGRICQALAD